MLSITPNAFEPQYRNCSNEVRSELQSIALTKSCTLPCLHTSMPLSEFSAMSLPALQTVTKEDELVTCTQHGGFGRASKQAKAGENSARAARTMKLR